MVLPQGTADKLVKKSLALLGGRCLDDDSLHLLHRASYSRDVDPETDVHEVFSDRILLLVRWAVKQTAIG